MPWDPGANGVGFSVELLSVGLAWGIACLSGVSSDIIILVIKCNGAENEAEG